MPTFTFPEIVSFIVATFAILLFVSDMIRKIRKPGPTLKSERVQEPALEVGTVITSREDLVMAPPGTVVAFPAKGVYVLAEHGELLPYSGDTPAPPFTGANAFVLQSPPRGSR